MGVHQATVSRTIHEVMDKIVEKQQEWIKFPQTRAQVQAAQEQWQRKYKFPYVIGVIDCTHVCISKPHQFGDDYVNRKGRITMNVQATCDSSETFTSADVRWPGSVHDSRILKNSLLYAHMNRIDSDAVILGDEGYGINRWLMVPYKTTNTVSERTFNRLFTKERVIIERCFGILKRRFPILAYKVRLDIKYAPSIIVCCLILHNVAKYLKDDDIPGDQIDEVVEHNPDETEQTIMSMTTARRLGQRRRNQIAEEILQTLEL